MKKILSFFKHITRRLSTFKLSTPSAVIIGSIIIAGSIVAYGFIVRPVGPVVQDLLKEVAKELKLKGSKWEACLASQEIKDQIGKELNDGIAAGVSGTPTTFVLVKKGDAYETVARIEGAQNEEFVRAAIDQALSGNATGASFAGAPISESDFIEGVRGNIIVLQYADAECPFCIRFHPTITTVMNDYKDKVGFAFRHFPLVSIHPNALPYATAIECAGNLKGKDAYFGFIDKLLTKEAGN